MRAHIYSYSSWSSMAFLTSLSNAGGDSTHASTEESAFTTQWQSADTSSLQPSNLSLSRVPRAWERKPLSPFSRSKMRVGKVWKRAAPVEIRKRRSLGGAGSKPVKKMRLNGGVSVARWDGEGEEGGELAQSPVRKIVLRRDRVGEEGFAALPDEEEEVLGQDDADDGAVVQVFDEDGALIDDDPEAVDAQQGWEDEAGHEDEFNPTLMHLDDITEQAQQRSGDGIDASRNEPSEQTVEQATPILTSSPAPEVALEPLALDQLTEQDVLPEPVAIQQAEVVLPAGFVSPAKSQAPPARKSVRNSSSSRRRTLPVQWRPSRLRQVTNVDDDERSPMSVTTEQPLELPEEPILLGSKTQVCDEAPNVAEDQTADQEWEDVEDVEDEPAVELEGDVSESLAGEDTSNELDMPVSQTPFEQVAEDEREGQSPTSVVQDALRHTSPSKLPSSPIPSIEGQHPRLPLRRSPRRKSSSPVKQSATRPSVEQSHLVAFTPIKGLRLRSDLMATSSNVGNLSSEDDIEDPAPPLLERSVSAPPEEPAMSPHRPARPRVSDDTALLQAFLNRAAENRSSSRRVSVSRRESITNRLDSDAVRQALASPAKPEVLADLDPNSPSPRKSIVASEEVDDANILPEPESSPLQKTRRSGRATKKAAPQTATPAAAPNKISIRGNSENVVLPKTEAQETSQLTRANTRKNKGTATLPLYRLAKIQQQGVVDPLDDGAAVEEENFSKPNSKGKALRWNETLVEFWQGGDVSETSLLTDELTTSGPVPIVGEAMEVHAEMPASSGPPPPAETPSKPKIRRLRAPRAAAAPGKGSSSSGDDTTKVESSEKASAVDTPAQTGVSAPKKRRSRIATPAKGLSNASLLPTDLEPTPAPASAPAPPAQTQIKKSIPTPSAGGRRKAPASKLPAPASFNLALSSSASSSLGQGKENLNSSPPKKKPGLSASMPASKTFAPKLDFGKSLAPSLGSQDESLPGLASPAKKVGKRGVMFAPSMSGGGTGESQEESQGREEVPLGLRSPAKKRTRRAAAGGL